MMYDNPYHYRGTPSIATEGELFTVRDNYGGKEKQKVGQPCAGVEHDHAKDTWPIETCQAGMIAGNWVCFMCGFLVFETDPDRIPTDTARTLRKGAFAHRSNHRVAWWCTAHCLEEPSVELPEVDTSRNE